MDLLGVLSVSCRLHLSWLDPHARSRSLHSTISCKHKWNGQAYSAAVTCRRSTAARKVQNGAAAALADGQLPRSCRGADEAPHYQALLLSFTQLQHCGC